MYMSIFFPFNIFKTHRPEYAIIYSPVSAHAHFSYGIFLFFSFYLCVFLCGRITHVGLFLEFLFIRPSKSFPLSFLFIHSLNFLFVHLYVRFFSHFSFARIERNFTNSTFVFPLYSFLILQLEVKN